MGNYKLNDMLKKEYIEIVGICERIYKEKKQAGQVLDYLSDCFYHTLSSKETANSDFLLAIYELEKYYFNIYKKELK